ncbi:hypothetical protein ACZ87_03756 [Candidatus Erwinia dacicola]|uniref:Uncharacterized protein n=1 Tax=Candidatus Erwinia dacicola TaxID=252393 RepID=A0A328TFU4_9GAMM|nr:hypothetical protein ACZ87_03756 [Candidatus Erwinia dacicola]
MGLKGRKLGEWSELAIQLARENAVEMAGEGLRAESVHLALESYRADLEAKVQRQKLDDRALYQPRSGAAF